jgi:hypothetical protein
VGKKLAARGSAGKIVAGTEDKRVVSTFDLDLPVPAVSASIEHFKLSRSVAFVPRRAEARQSHRKKITQKNTPC